MGASTAEDDRRRELPTEAALSEAGEIMIKDKDGKEIPLKSLYTGKPADERQLLIFIRHFFCGVSAYLARVPEWQYHCNTTCMLCEQ